MPLTITPGASDTDSYVDVDAFKTYCERIGYDVTGKADTDLEQALRRGTRGLDGIYGQRFIGSPTSADQALEWPRTGAAWRGSDIPGDIVPQKVKDAACEAAWRELTVPGSLSPDQERGGRIKRKREKVEGAIDEETEWMDGAPAETTFSAIEGLLSGLITRKAGGTTFGFVARA
ncbi:DnaT-like ssDNA-binding protein [Pseudaminobacter soli (ex Li et al. 2025)]|uniref:Putative DnaT-like domain-containing protein n=1 Tax=Pseudaminobacter soli (ex Li et al. 2025) TaxID=1295366 RepID=A0A2P7SE50_9HYPH|nr:DnaT-like ssDNA-binding protein [Mesorhizobium soli]PSJ60750.1 hypothetical protein C7I85_11960 [Mesorhizobium soli]